MNFNPNPLYYEMIRIFAENYSTETTLGICNEGGSRSSKTWDAFHFLVTFCDHNRNGNNDIYILRDTLTNCRDYTFKDFKRCINMIGVPDVEYKSEGQKPECRIWGNNFYFRGLDDEANTEAYPSDIIFVNEALETSETKVAGLRMRCRKMMIYDWNPKYTAHWCFKMETRPNYHFTHSTYKNNKHLPNNIINEIESYCPWELEDLHLPEESRRPNLENLKNQTADKFRWQVYGEGKRAAHEGLIFPNVEYIDAWPQDVAKVLSMDFGFINDPTALVYVGEKGNDIYAELLLYQPCETSSQIDDFARKMNIDIKLPCTADSSDKYTGENKGTVEMVSELRLKGWSIRKVKKTQSVIYWVGEMKNKRIHIITNSLVGHVREEQENYTFKTINGIAINQPIDKFNHFWDAFRYGYMSMHINTFMAGTI